MVTKVIKIGKGTKLVEAVVRVRDKNTEIPEWEELREREQGNSTQKNGNKAIKINYVNRIIDTDTHEINKGCFRIDPESIFIGELEIKFLGDTPFKHLELVELQDFDHRLLRKYTQTEERTMPELPIWTIRPNRKDSYFLSYFPVVNRTKDTSSLRIVFDAKAKDKTTLTERIFKREIQWVN